MRRLKRILAFFLSLLALSVLVFCFARWAPGDPLTAWYGERAERLTPEARAEAEAALGLDRPLAVQYGIWLAHAVRGDFGLSYQYRAPAASVIAARAGNTLLLGGVSLAVIAVLAAALALACARFAGRTADRVVCRLGTLTGCVPEFWLALVLIVVFSVRLRLLPSGGAYTIGGGGAADRLRHLVLPAASVVVSHVWQFASVLRSRLVEEAQSGYALAARARGLACGRVLTRYCLRCAAPACLSLLAVSIPHILCGTYVVELAFSYPGLGTLAYESVRYGDYNLLMLLCLLSGAAVMLCSAAARALAGRLDARMRAPAEAEAAR